LQRCISTLSFPIGLLTGYTPVESNSERWATTLLTLTTCTALTITLTLAVAHVCVWVCAHSEWLRSSVVWSVVSRLRYITYRQLAPAAPFSRLTDDDGDGDEWSDDVRRSSRLHRLLRPSTSLTSLSPIRYLALTALSLLKQCCALSVCPIPLHKNSAFRVLALFYCVPRPCGGLNIAAMCLSLCMPVSVPCL